MKIGFDAKRAFHNRTGLGHYSRTLIRSLATYFPAHQYFLFNPKPSSAFRFADDNIREIRPTGIFQKTFSSFWRSSGVKKDLEELGIDLYHGLSHEIPIGISHTKTRSVVTIHDLIHERFPEQYSAVDVKIYQRKFRYACAHADHIIAISEQTKKDIVEFYHTPEERITVCYQSCNPAFGQPVMEVARKKICEIYGLPEKFFLYVGSIVERKNLLNICKAMFLLRYELDLPLVVIGEGGKYKQQVKDFIRQHGLESRILFLSDTAVARQSADYQSAADFPAIYQSATALIYPSFFEGFGIPVLEALWSRIPVITSNRSSLPEAGGPGAHYIDPHHAEEIAAAMKRIYQDQEYAAGLAAKGWDYAQRFSQQSCAADVMAVYEKTMQQVKQS